MSRFSHEFSGGQRQRIGIARALSVDPKFIVCDEPISALDVSIQAQVINMLKNLQDELGLTYLFIAHDLSVVKYISDRVIVMYLGNIVEQAPAEVIFRNCANSHPYTEGLMLSIPRLETTSDRLEPIPGVVPHPLALPKGCKFGPRCKYCTKKCIEEEPPLVKVEENQTIRCFYPNKEERNSAEHKKITVHH